MPAPRDHIDSGRESGCQLPRAGAALHGDRAEGADDKAKVALLRGRQREHHPRFRCRAVQRIVDIHDQRVAHQRDSVAEEGGISRVEAVAAGNAERTQQSLQPREQLVGDGIRIGDRLHRVAVFGAEHGEGVFQQCGEAVQMPAVEMVGVAHQAAARYNGRVARLLAGRFKQRQQRRRGSCGRDAAIEESHQEQVDQFSAQAFKTGQWPLLLELAQGFEGIAGGVEHGGDAFERWRLLRAECLDAVLQLRDGRE